MVLSWQGGDLYYLASSGSRRTLRRHKKVNPLLIGSYIKFEQFHAMLRAAISKTGYAQ